MKKMFAWSLLGVCSIAWFAGSAQLPQFETKRLEELMVSHEPVSVTADAEGVYITLVRDAEIYRCRISPYVDINNPSSFQPGYDIFCDLMEEASSNSQI